MSIWVIEYFGQQQLTHAFWFITLMTAPLWLALLLFPDNGMVRRLAHPFLFPTVLCGVLFYLYLQVYGLGLPAISGVRFKQTSLFLRHPGVLLILWCKLMIFNLFLGLVIFREGRRLRINVAPELLVAWLLGPLALIVFAVRVGILHWIRKLKRRA